MENISLDYMFEMETYLLHMKEKVESPPGS